MTGKGRCVIIGDNPSHKRRRNLELSNRKGKVEGKDDLMAYALHVPIYCTVLLRTVLSVRLDFSDQKATQNLYIFINPVMTMQTFKVL